jgi:HD-GYP domain-containing protein (c-di-GMP phosphodiesterase class II)
VKRIEGYGPIADIILAHHERIDGRGYHRGLAAGTLPADARILAVADIYDALSAARPYREALPHGRVMEIMRADAGPGTCPECFAALCVAVNAAP